MANVGRFVPSFATRVLSSNSKFAVTRTSPFASNVHEGSRPPHAPAQPVNRAWARGDAFNVCELPAGTLASHAPAPLPQLSPAPLTWPGPFTATTMRAFAGGGGGAVKRAPTRTSPSSLTEQLPLPEQAPDHPPNVQPDAGAAVSATDVPV